MLERFLNPVDEERAYRVLRRLARHAVCDWVLTGGFAAEIHHVLLRRPCWQRPLIDIDFVVDAFEQVPDSLAEDFRFRHIHPFDSPGKTLLQAIDPHEAVRIDVFRAFGNTVDRASKLHLRSGELQLISLEDLTARAARLAFDLVGGVAVPGKYVRDFERLCMLVDPAHVEFAWQDQRKTGQPATFAEAHARLRNVIDSCSRNLLVEPSYSTDVNGGCPRCHATSTFALAEPQWVLSVLGYC